MKKIYLLLFFLISSSINFSQIRNVNYDSTLAKSLGADDYGMKSYVFVILKTGSYNPQEKEIRDSLFAGHMKNINRLVEEKKLIVAGPFGKNDLQYRGLFILNAKDIEEARSLVSTDPAVKANIFDVELIPWYGSAALPEYLKAADKIWKINP
jgi:uncharacterized protein YciI